MRFFIGLALVIGLLAVPLAAYALSRCNQHMCPAAQASYESGHQAVSQVSLATVSEDELE